MDKKGKIYKLYCDDGHYYYGSTIHKYLSARLSIHREDSKNKYLNSKVYKHINSIGWDRVKIILVEEFDYTTRDDMKRRENKYIVESLSDPLCLNHNRAIITDEERLEKVRQRNRSIRENNKKIVVCECGMEHTFGRTQQHLNSVNHRYRIEQQNLHKHTESETVFMIDL